MSLLEIPESMDLQYAGCYQCIDQDFSPVFCECRMKSGNVLNMDKSSIGNVYMGGSGGGTVQDDTKTLYLHGDGWRGVFICITPLFILNTLQMLELAENYRNVNSKMC